MVKKRDRTLFEILARLNWIQILREAIEGRPMSWSEYPVREFRNASDQVLYSLDKELRRKGIDAHSVYIKKEAKANV